MARDPESAAQPFLRRLLEAAKWRVEPIPYGWRAVDPDPGDRVVLAYGERELPAGFQRHLPDRHREVIVLLGHVPSPHEADRLDLAGARGLGPDDAPGAVLEWLRPAGSPAGAPGAAGPASPGTVPEAEALGAPAESAPSAAPEVLITPDWVEPPALPPTPRSGPPSEILLRQDPEALPPQVFDSDRIVRPRLQEEDLHRMAVGRWRGGSPRLVLVPFYLFAYALPEDDDAPSAPPRLVAVPAVGGEPQFWPPGDREIISALGHPHHRHERRLDAGRARALAMEAVRERHARHEESAEQRRGMLEIEHRRHPREEGEVRLGPPALLWVPHWVVEAWNGREVLDAVTGLPAHLQLERTDPSG